MTHTHQSGSRSFSESSVTTCTCQIAAFGVDLEGMSSCRILGETASGGMLEGMPAVGQQQIATSSKSVDTPSSNASRAAAWPDVSPFSTPPFGTDSIVMGDAK